MLGNAPRILFFVLTGLLAGLAHVYLYRRLVRDATSHARIRSLAKVTMLGLGGTAMLVRPVSRVIGPGLPGWIFTPLLVWVGFALYLLMVTLALDAFRAAVLRWRERQRQPLSPERRAFLARSLAAGSAAMGGGLGVFGTWRAFRTPEISEIQVRLPGLPRALDGFTIVHLTDVHVGPVIQRKFMEELVARANAARPDLVAITGDLVDGTVDQLGWHVAALGGLKARYGAHFVTGNHDYYAGADEWVRALEGLGLNVLRNRRVEIGDPGASFDLVGVDDWGARRGNREVWLGRRTAGYDLEKAVAGRDPERASVLLAHQPTNLAEVSRHRIGLQLSGHTHGGQMFPGTGIARLVWGERSDGLSRQGNTWLFVSRGCGFVGPPMRVGSPPEIARITLLAG
jgi:hypothetical protein